MKILECKAVLSLFLISLLLTCGCGPNLPEGMPKLTPVSLTVTQEGVPLAEAQVSLTPLAEETKYGSGGVTDADGRLLVLTHGQYKGVPQGEYIITVRKQETITEGPVDQIPKDPQASRAWMYKNSHLLKKQRYELVGEKYRNSQTSDLKLTVGPSPVKETFDVGKPVRSKVKQSFDRK
ncbi:MAG: carboxypeptidase-like regulatory domain-containing protein [Planctomycetia bacterium]|nr:carboxypeptidase-like regulatory domain-containing protein [Planctomycetia bacterium]